MPFFPLLPSPSKLGGLSHPPGQRLRCTKGQMIVPTDLETKIKFTTGAQAWPRAEFGSNKLPVGWFAFYNFWHEVLILALAAGRGRARGRAPGLEHSRLLGNLEFFAPGKHVTQDGYCRVDRRRDALDLGCTAMGRTWQWKLIPPARSKHVWDNSQVTLSLAGRLE